MNESIFESLVQPLNRVERENPRLKLTRVLALVLIAAVGLGTSAQSEEGVGARLQGVWMDKDGKVTYSFLKNNEFRFRGMRPIYTQRPGERFSSPSGELEPYTVEGLWDAGSTCWLGREGERGDPGNLMLFIGTGQCCLRAKWLGTSLVLTEIWNKGSETLSACENRVLIRAKPGVNR